MLLINKILLATIYIIHKAFRGFRALSPASILGGNLLGKKPAIFYFAYTYRCSALGKLPNNQSVVKSKKVIILSIKEKIIMNSKVKIASVFGILLIAFLFTSCNQKSNKNEIKSDFSQKDKLKSRIALIDSSEISSVRLTLIRGAFHWDTLKLIGNELMYIPSNAGYLKDYPEYQIKSMTTLDNSLVVSLINNLIKNEIFKMDSLYDNMTSCDSKLEIELTVLAKTIKIKCNDYQNGCPEILTKLEELLVELHGKGLKRIILPG